jgi:hypothetical protein
MSNNHSFGFSFFLWWLPKTDHKELLNEVVYVYVNFYLRMDVQSDTQALCHTVYCEI